MAVPILKHGEYLIASLHAEPTDASTRALQCSSAWASAVVSVIAETRVPVRADVDIISARQRGRELAAELGFSTTELALIATAISELARNIVTYAGRGEIVFSLVEDGNRRGIVVVARDEGPGIAELERALEDGYSTSGSLGVGLPGARRLMDEFEIASELGRGTTVRATKWAG